MKSKMRILILNNNASGIYNLRNELLVELLKESEVFVCCPYDEYVKRLEEMGCIHIPCIMERHGINPLHEMRLIFFYRSLLKKNKPDICLTYTIKPNAYGGAACAALKVPYISNITGLGSAVEHKGILHMAAVHLYRYGLRKSRMVFFQNAANRDFMLKQHIVKGKYKLLPGSGVNLERYQLLEYPNGDTVDFAYIGRIMKEKGIEQYLETAVEIHKRHPDAIFHVCGRYEDDYKDRIEKLSKKNIIKYHGDVRNMREIYQIIQCTIHPSYYAEGMSNVLLETAASGRAIITTARPGCGEVVDNGVNGFLIKEKDSRDLIEKIEEFLNMPIEDRRQMGLAGRRKAEREFDRKQVVRAYMRAINDISNAV